MSGYSKQAQHQDVLNQAANSLNQIYSSYTVKEQESAMMSISVDYLCHLQELLLAYAETYENYTSVDSPLHVASGKLEVVC